MSQHAVTVCKHNTGCTNIPEGLGLLMGVRGASALRPPAGLPLPVRAFGGLRPFGTGRPFGGLRPCGGLRPFGTGRPPGTLPLPASGRGRDF